MKHRISKTLLVLLACASALTACVYATVGPFTPSTSAPDASVAVADGGAAAPHLGSIVQVWNGDLDGSTNATKIVTGVQGHAIPTPAVGALYFDGGSWSFNTIPVVPGSAGQALFTSDAGTAATWAYPHGDVDASATDPGKLTVNAIQGFGVSTSVPSTNNALVWNGSLWAPSNISTSSITPGSAGTFLVTNGSSATAWSTLDTFDTTHGRITAGGGGSDKSVIVGPISGSETTAAGVQCDATTSSCIVGTNKAGAVLNLTSGAGSNTVSLDESGSNGDVTIAHGGSTIFRAGHYNGGTTYAAIWLNGNAASPSGTNYTFLDSGTGYTALNGSGSLYLAIGNINYVTLNSSSFSTSVPVSLGSTTGANTLTGSLNFTTRTVTSAFTVDTTTTDNIIFADCSTSGITITLPTPTAGRVLTVIDQKNNCNASTGKEVTLARHGTESIDGTAGNVTITTSGARTDIYSDGTNWFTHMGTKAN